MCALVLLQTHGIRTAYTLQETAKLARGSCVAIPAVLSQALTSAADSRGMGGGDPLEIHI